MSPSPRASSKSPLTVTNLKFFFFLLLFKINYTFDIMSSRSRRRVSEMFYKMYPQNIAGLVSKQVDSTIDSTTTVVLV